MLMHCLNGKIQKLIAIGSSTKGQSQGHIFIRVLVIIFQKSHCLVKIIRRHKHRTQQLYAINASSWIVKVDTSYISKKYESQLLQGTEPLEVTLGKYQLVPPTENE